jgi:hypothetical protein
MLDAFVKAGSHYMTRAEWGCLDDDHRSWAIVEAMDDAQAHFMVPPVLRPNAKVIRLFDSPRSTLTRFMSYRRSDLRN